MTRNTAREIATHLAYELSFTDLPIQEFLDQQLSRENFAARAEECGLYADTPNDKQEKYIRRLVSGVAEHAAELAQRLRGMQCHVNVIPLNSVEEKALRGADEAAIERFMQELERRHISVTRRREMGDDIDGACGQLRRHYLADQAERQE